MKINCTAIRRLTAENVNDALAVYENVKLAHCWPVDPSAFARAIKPACDGSSDCGWVGYADERPVLLLHACANAWDDHGHTIDALGAIRFLFFERGFHSLAREALDAAEHWMIERGCARVRVMHYNEKYPFFHIRHTHLPSQLDHVHAFLAERGYSRGECELAYTWPDLDSFAAGDSPVALDDVEIRHVDAGAIRPNIEVRCSKADELVAVGFADSAVSISDNTLLPGHVCDAAAGQCDHTNRITASDVAYIKWLQVDEPLQGLGLGRWTLLRTLQAAREAGYKAATICVLGHNHRPWILYSGIGCQLVDWSWVCEKDLS